MTDNNSSVYNSSSGYTNNNSSNHSSSTFFISSNHATASAPVSGTRNSITTPTSNNPSSARKSTAAVTGTLRNSENYDKSTSLSSLLHQQHTTPLALPPPSSSSPAKRSSLMSITSRSSGRDGVTQQHPHRRVSFTTDAVSGGGRTSMTSVGIGRGGRSSSNYYSTASNASSTDRRYDSSNRCIVCWNGGVRWFQNCIDHDVPSVKYRRKLFKKYLRCRVWKIVMICFTIVLLFGSQIRDLFVLPIVMDTLFDVLFMLCLLFFAIDIIMRVDTENNYFDLFGVCAFYKRKLNRRRRHRQQQQLLLQQQRGGQNQQQLHQSISDDNDYSSSHHRASSSTNHVNTTTSSWTTYFNWGSFLFWCDLVSTLSLLYEISWINPNFFREATYDIKVDTNGIPINGRLDIQGTGNPIQIYEIVLYIAICKAARMARFIRSSTVVRLSSKINWYFFINNLFNPIFYYKFISKCCTYGPKYAIKYTYQQYNNVDTYNGHRIQTASNRIRNTGTLLVNDNGYDEISERTDTTENVALATSISKIPNASNDSFHTGSLYDGSSDNMASNSIRTNQLAHSSSSSTKVGTAMRELTSQRVALSILIGLVLTVAFTYTEDDATKPSTMIVLHSQTSVPQYVNKALTAARVSSIPDLFSYQLSNGTTIYFDNLNSDNPIPERLRPREILTISIADIMTGGTITVGNFINRAQRRKEAWVSLLYTLFIVLVWVFGVTAFAGPVMVLVVIPIERMVRLLAMLMVDPLGYQSTRNYKRFVSEGDNITRNTKWSKDVLKGMETSFLMSTILRIGNLMKVGFGSAGVEIIRQNLAKSQSNNMSLLNSQGSIVSCIFLFCDIRNFTDATESLQEEVFVFTNSVAAVVHSHCASLGGSANKNVGDAFLLSWLLDEVGDDQDDIFYDDGGQGGSSENFTARKNQADKCLLAVVRICMALRLDDYYLSALSHGARDALITKLQNRPGSIVQMGCGLHAGKAVQGAIGSQRKIDATYVSEAVERAEFLESSTKKYGVNMLMSGSFHRLLDQRNKRRCRKVDQILFHDEENEDDEEENGQVMDMLTFDMDIDALGYETLADNGHSESEGTTNEVDVRFLAATAAKLKKKSTSARKLLHRDNDDLEDFSETDASGGGLQAGAVGNTAKVVNNEATYNNMGGKKHNIKLVLPSGPAMYNPNVWVSEEMKLIRQRYSDGIFFQKFNAGLQSFYSKDWDDAKQCFQTILSRFEDGPSRYFLTQIEKNNGKPPRDFLGYGTA